MGDEFATLAALGRFLDRINTHIYSIVQKGEVANFSPADANEILWYEVIKAVHSKYRHTHAIEDSYRLSVSTLVEVMAEGGKTDYKSLIQYCVAEHRGHFLHRRDDQKLVVRRAPRLYEGLMEEVVARQPDDEDVVRRVVDRVEAVLSHLKRPEARLLRRRYLDGETSWEELRQAFKKKTVAAVKEGLRRAERKFELIYTRVRANEVQAPSIDFDNAAPNATHFSSALG